MASEGGHFSWLQFAPGVEHETIHVATFAVGAVVFLGLGVAATAALKSAPNPAEPSGKFNLRGFFEIMLEFITKQSDDIIGHAGRKFVPFFTFLFLFIFFNNLVGLLPGMTPATDNINTTFAIGIISFILYNAVGIKEQGLIPYLKHFAGPVTKGFFVIIAILLFAIELISHLFRPFTLGLRLMGNMTGDHTVLGTFLNLVPVGVPVIFYGLGLFVCFVQALVFTLLSMVYVSMAQAHDH